MSQAQGREAPIAVLDQCSRRSAALRFAPVPAATSLAERRGPAWAPARPGSRSSGSSGGHATDAEGSEAQLVARGSARAQAPKPSTCSRDHVARSTFLNIGPGRLRLTSLVMRHRHNTILYSSTCNITQNTRCMHACM